MVDPPAPDHPDGPSTMVCEVAYARPDRQLLVAVTLPLYATVQDALSQALANGWRTICPEIDEARAVLGVFGKVVASDHRLQPGDRVEVYRPLETDPRSARRARVKAAR